MAVTTQQSPFTLAQPALNASLAFSDQNASALRKLLALLALATSAGQYKWGNTPGLGALGGGVNLAGGIAALADPNSTTASKASGGMTAATGATQLGAAAGVPAAQAVAPYLGPATAGVGLGLSLADIAGRDDLSGKQKAGHMNEAAGETALSVGVPYAALGILARHINGMLERSNSPQVSGVGKGLGFAARPVEGLLSVLRGDQSPRAAGNTMVAQARDTPGLKQLINPVFDFLGLGTKPTEGTQFRSSLQDYFKRAGLPDFNRADPNTYNVDLTKFTPDRIAKADQLSRQIVPGGGPYQGQALAILLNSGAV